MNKTAFFDVIQRFHLNQWPVLLAVYGLLRVIFGLNYVVIYGFILLLFALRVQLEHMLIVFFSLAIVLYVLGQDVEANHAMSFVFGFMVLILVRHVLGYLKLHHR